jgi:Zn-dependent protease
MRQNLVIARIRGIEIGVNWSLAFIATLLTWLLAEEVLPLSAPGYGPTSYWVGAAVTVALFFVSLVAHELGHAFVARRHGVEVKKVTLWLLGGVATMEKDSGDPSSELRIGGVGPLVSLALGMVILAIAVAASAIPSLELVAAALAWVALTNLVLGAFNLLPAFPLDGGRVLRAILWRRSGDRVRATQQSGAVSEALAYLMVVGATLLIWNGFVLNGLWFVLIAWFLFQAAAAEVAGVTQNELLHDVSVAEVMSSDPITVTADLPVGLLIDDYLFRFRHSAYPVVDATGRVIGLVTLDCIRGLDPALRSVTSVGSIAIPLRALTVLHPTDPATNALRGLAGPGPGRALVLDERGQLVGVLSAKDITATLQIRAIVGPALGRDGEAGAAPASPDTPVARSNGPT